MLIRFLTNEPEYVDQRAFEDYSRKYNLSKPNLSKPPGADESSVGGHSIPRKYSGDDLVKHVVQFDLFFKQNRTITKIVSIREHGKEAFAKVELNGWRSEDGAKYLTLLYDVLLYKEDDGWRIFRMNLRNKGDEQYNDLYYFYANPTENL